MGNKSIQHGVTASIELILSDRTKCREDLSTMMPDFAQAFYAARIIVHGREPKYDMAMQLRSADFTPEDPAESGRVLEGLMRMVGVTLRLYISEPTWRDIFNGYRIRLWLRWRSLWSKPTPFPEDITE